MSQEIIEGWRGVMVSMGLGSPMSRAVTMGLLTGILSYSLKYPHDAFQRDGTIRPSAHMSPSPDATNTHFLLTPLAVATTTFLFT